MVAIDQIKGVRPAQGNCWVGACELERTAAQIGSLEMMSFDRGDHSERNASGFTPVYAGIASIGHCVSSNCSPNGPVAHG